MMVNPPRKKTQKWSQMKQRLSTSIVGLSTTSLVNTSTQRPLATWTARSEFVCPTIGVADAVLKGNAYEIEGGMNCRCSHHFCEGYGSCQCRHGEDDHRTLLRVMQVRVFSFFYNAHTLSLHRNKGISSKSYFFAGGISSLRTHIARYVASHRHPHLSHFSHVWTGTRITFRFIKSVVPS